jgi:hypothetical protein
VNLTVERQLLRESKLRLSYIGTQGRNLLQYRFENLPVKPDGVTWKVASDRAARARLGGCSDDRGVSERGADRGERDQPARTAHE